MKHYNYQNLNEVSSYSPDVDKLATALCRDAQKRLATFPITETSQVWEKKEDVVSYIILGFDLKVEFIVYNFPTEDDYYDYPSEIPPINGFDGDSCKITVTLIAVSGKLLMGEARENMRHEVEHFYQWRLNKIHNPNFTGLSNNLYRKALPILRGEERPVNDLEVTIANIIYNTFPPEQDAYTQEYHQQAVNYPGDYDDRDTDVEQRYSYLCGLLQKYKRALGTPEMEAAFKPFRSRGCTPESFYNLARKG
ncbi:MAG: hypothetical protein LUD72_06255 [Bacteroidales bacterium]|nr:hypothetical protein [Bacteroidales bacterium]